MDFAYTQEDEAFRDELMQWLAERLPPFLEKWSADDEGDGPAGATGIMRSMERRRAWQRELNQGRWAAIHLAAGVGRARRHGHPERDLLGGDGGAPHARHLQRQRPVANRTDDHPVGHGGAEAALDPEHPECRRPLVPGLHRARGR
jgi:hypothetical protein